MSDRLPPETALQWWRALTLCWTLVQAVVPIALFIFANALLSQCVGGSSCAWYGVEWKTELTIMSLSLLLTAPVGILALVWFGLRIFQTAPANERAAVSAAVLPVGVYRLFSMLLAILTIGFASPLIVLALGKVRILSPGQAFELAKPLVVFVFLGAPGFWLWGIALVASRKALSAKARNLTAT